MIVQIRHKIPVCYSVCSFQRKDMTKIFRTSRYLPTNIKVLTIGGLYMLHDDIGYLGNTLYTLYRIISFISCVTAIVWVIAGFVASENFVLVDNAPAVLHTCKSKIKHTNILVPTKPIEPNLIIVIIYLKMQPRSGIKKVIIISSNFHHLCLSLSVFLCETKAVA